MVVDFIASNNESEIEKVKKERKIECNEALGDNLDNISPRVLASALLSLSFPLLLIIYAKIVLSLFSFVLASHLTSYFPTYQHTTARHLSLPPSPSSSPLSMIIFRVFRTSSRKQTDKHIYIFINISSLLSQSLSPFSFLNEHLKTNPACHVWNFEDKRL